MNGLTQTEMLKALSTCRKRVESYEPKKQRSRDTSHARNIVIGCVQTVSQCGESISGWLKHKPERKSCLKSPGMKKSVRVLRDLLDYAEAVVAAAVWVDRFWLGALPVDEPKRISAAQKAAMQAGRAAAREVQKARRQRRMDAA